MLKVGRVYVRVGRAKMHKGHGGRGNVQVGFEAIKARFEMAQSATMDYLNISERQLNKTCWANNVFK